MKPITGRREYGTQFGDGAVRTDRYRHPAHCRCGWLQFSLLTDYPPPTELVGLVQ